MKKDSKKLFSMFARYGLLVLVALPGMSLFYYLFLPLTIYPIVGILSLFFKVILNQNIIHIGGLSIKIIDTCVAGAAYYFLLVLNLSTPEIKLKKRVKIIFLSFGIFLGINVLRIVLLSFIYLGIPSIYEFTHKMFWYLGSTLFVVGIWFFMVKNFEVKKIPFFSDLNFLYKKSSFKLGKNKTKLNKESTNKILI